MEWRAVVSRPRQATGPTGPASRRLGSRARTAWATFGGAGRSRSAPTCRPSCEWESRKVGGGGRCFVSASVSAQCSVFSAQCSVCAAHLGLAAPSHRSIGGGGGGIGGRVVERGSVSHRSSGHAVELTPMIAPLQEGHSSFKTTTRRSVEWMAKNHSRVEAPRVHAHTTNGLATTLRTGVARLYVHPPLKVSHAGTSVLLSSRYSMTPLPRLRPRP